MSDGAMVIIGASAAGVGAALGARAAGYKGDVVLMGAELGLPYERPALSKNELPTNGEGPPPIVSSEVLSEHRIDYRDGLRAQSIDLETRTVMTDRDGAVAAAVIVLATGARVRRVRFDIAPTHGVHYLRDTDDARMLHRSLARGSGPVVLLGGGFIGLEIAAVAASLGRDVVVIDAGAELLDRSGMAVIGGRLRVLHEQRGVQFRLGNTVRKLHEKGGVLSAVELANGEVLDTSTLVVGIGVQPRDELAIDAGLAVEDGVKVDRFGRTSNPHVWAAGDVANQPHPLLASSARIEHWNVAMQHGQAVGASAAGVLTEYVDAPYFWSDQFDVTLQMFGRPADSDHVVCRRSESASPVWFWVRDSMLSAVASMGSAREVRAGKRLIETKQLVSAADLEDPNTDLRKLK